MLNEPLRSPVLRPIRALQHQSYLGCPWDAETRQPRVMSCAHTDTPPPSSPDVTPHSRENPTRTTHYRMGNGDIQSHRICTLEMAGAAHDSMDQRKGRAGSSLPSDTSHVAQEFGHVEKRDSYLPRFDMSAFTGVRAFASNNGHPISCKATDPSKATMTRDCHFYKWAITGMGPLEKVATGCSLVGSGRGSSA